MAEGEEKKIPMTYEEFFECVKEGVMERMPQLTEEQADDYLRDEWSIFVIKDQYTVSAKWYLLGIDSYDQFCIGAVSAAAHCLKLLW